MSSINVKSGDQILQVLSPLPEEVELFQVRTRVSKDQEKSIEQLTADVYNRFAGQVNVNFNFKELTRELDEADTRMYDVCNVFEALGLVSKVKKNQYCWFGWDLGMIPTLRHLKTLADSENLNSLFLDPSFPGSVTNSKGEMNCSLQILTEKIMMLLLLLSRDEVLSREQLFNFLYQNAPEKTKNSGPLRIAKVLKILLTLRLIQEDQGNVQKPNSRGNIRWFTSFKYVGPHIEAYDEVYEVIEVTTIVEVDEDGDYTTQVIPKILGKCVMENSIDIEFIEETSCHLQENFTKNFGFGDILVKDEILED